MWVALNFDFNVSFTGEDDWNCPGCRFRDPEKFIKRLLSQIDTLVHFWYTLSVIRSAEAAAPNEFPTHAMMISCRRWALRSF